MVIKTRFSTALLSLVAALLSTTAPMMLVAADNEEQDGTNTLCDTSPDALTEAFANMGMPEEQVSHTCIESTGYEGERCFYTYVPDCAGQNSPLVYDIHGVSLCPLWNFETTLWVQKAIENCFVLVWPTGNTEPEIAQFSCFALEGGYGPVGPPGEEPQYETPNCCCFKGFTGPIEANITDDLTFLRNVAAVAVPDVAKKSNGAVTIDTKRIYMGGHSNGCSAALAMAAVHSDMVAAVCCHSPSLIQGFDEDYSPVPTWIVHGRKDGTVPYEGSGPRGQTYNPGAVQLNDIFGQANNCSGNVTETEIEGGSIRQQTNCTNDAIVELVTLDDSGHTPFLDAPLFDAGMNPDSNLGAQVTTLDTTELAWTFCSAYMSATEPELVQVFAPSDPPTEDTPTKTPTENPTSCSAQSWDLSLFLSALPFWMLSFLWVFC